MEARRRVAAAGPLEQFSSQLRSIRLFFFVAVEASRGITWETRQSSCLRSERRRHLRALWGVMVLEHYMDLQDDTGQIGMTALRCTNCGEVIDPVILQNRIKPAPNLLYGTKQRKYAQRVGGDEADVTVKMDGDSHGAGHGN